MNEEKEGLGFLRPAIHDWRDVYEQIWQTIEVQFALSKKDTAEQRQARITQIFGDPVLLGRLLLCFTETIDWSFRRRLEMVQATGELGEIKEPILYRTPPKVWWCDMPVLQAEIRLPKSIKGTKQVYYDVADIWAPLGLHINLIYKGEGKRECSAIEMMKD